MEENRVCDSGRLKGGRAIMRLKALRVPAVLPGWSVFFMLETWLILPVVIRSSQRLSHACLSINPILVKLRMAHYISYSVFDNPLLFG